MDNFCPLDRFGCSKVVHWSNTHKKILKKLTIVFGVNQLMSTHWLPMTTPLNQLMSTHWLPMTTPLNQLMSTPLLPMTTIINQLMSTPLLPMTTISSSLDLPFWHCPTSKI
jgi:hypothetical protein